METIPARMLQRWIETLVKAEAALQAADDQRPCIDRSVWAKVWPAKSAVSSMRAELLRIAVTDVAVETMEPAL